MSERVEFEIQVEDAKVQHGWLAIGGREGRYYLDGEDSLVFTKTRKVEDARKVMGEIAQSIADIASYDYHPYAGKRLRIVKITTVTTYDVVE